ncbi:MAG: asparagine synthetase B family protein [Spirulinaceae cyanobacterium]
MSGICCVFNRDGRAIAPEILPKMFSSLAFRGPDAQNHWFQGAIGFGYTRLAITPEEQSEIQPLNWHEQIYLVADMRLDGREVLRSQLRSAGIAIADLNRGREGLKPSPTGGSTEISDAQLFLQAYRVWGRACLDHIQGDFCFVLWDAREQRLWCGRDQLGVRQLYYAVNAEVMVVSNTLRTVQCHPAISRQLNGQAIADFLLLGFNQNPQTTTFADIQRLPAGHTLTVTPTQVRAQRYWQLPVPSLRRHSSPHETIEVFQWHLDQAVGDRLRLPQASIFLSGGLDSAALAASACAQMRNLPEFRLHGLTVTYEHLIPDAETIYANQIAQTLGLPLTELKADEFGLCAGTQLTPEPSLQLFPDLEQAQYRWVAEHSRVVLYGQGGDEGMRPSTVRQLVGRMPMGALLGGLWQTVWRYRRRPHWGTGVKGIWRSQTSPDPWRGYPSWLNPEFERAFQVRDRWLALTAATPEPNPHPLRPRAYRQLLQPLWQLNFEACDSGVHGQPVTVLFPYLDLRLLDYLLSLPPYPWFVDKLLAREALRRQTIPRAIADRPKTPLGGHPFWAWLQQGADPWQEQDWSGAITEYIDPARLTQIIQRQPLPFGTAWAALRPVFLQQWLQGDNSGS